MACLGLAGVFVAYYSLYEPLSWKWRAAHPNDRVYFVDHGSNYTGSVILASGMDRCAYGMPLKAQRYSRRIGVAAAAGFLTFANYYEEDPALSFAHPTDQGTFTMDEQDFVMGMAGVATYVAGAEILDKFFHTSIDAVCK